jgi:putative FmdB family regulatory protein
MPLYEYECDACGQRFELIQKFSDPAPAACVKCGKGPVHRQPSSPAIQFKGSGWYVTDYAQKGKPAAAGASSDKSDKSEKTDKTEKSEKTEPKKTSDAGSTPAATKD